LLVAVVVGHIKKLEEMVRLVAVMPLIMGEVIQLLVLLTLVVVVVEVLMTLQSLIIWEDQEPLEVLVLFTLSTLPLTQQHFLLALHRPQLLLAVLSIPQSQPQAHLTQ
jgi:hypothetical protein